MQDVLAEGVRYERAGVLQRAYEAYARVADDAADPAVRAEALRRAADVERTRCSWQRAIELAQRSGELATEAGRNDLRAEALNAEAAVYQSQGRFDEAVELLESILAGTEDARIVGIAQQNLGTIAALRGDHETAQKRFRASTDAFRDVRYDRGEAIALTNYARALLDMGDFERAESACVEAEAAARRVDDLEIVSIAKMNLAEALFARGEQETSLGLLSAALGHFSSVGNRWREIEAMRLLGDIHARRGDDATARRSWSQAESIAQKIGAERELGELRKRLGALE